MPNLIVNIFDGNNGAGSAKDTMLKASEASNEVPSLLMATGAKLSSTMSDPFIGYEEWTLLIDHWTAAKVKYHWPKFKLSKTISESLLAKKARIVVEREELGLDPVSPPPPPSPRLLGTYTEEGLPVSGIPWVAGSYSGYTDSDGKMWVDGSETGELDLIVDTVHGAGLLDAEETVDIDVSEIYIS